MDPNLCFCLPLALAVLSMGAHAQDAIVPDWFPAIQAVVQGATDMGTHGTAEIPVRAGTCAEHVLAQRSNLTFAGEGAAITTPREQPRGRLLG
jgi:pectin methylesterase-like acyl-CoA thioesterase